MDKLDSVQEALGVSFRDGELLRQALAHSSYLNENPGAFALPNERLEFLGDAVVGLAVAQELYRVHPDWSEGLLTQARAALVQGETLARLADQVGLGRYLYMGKGEEASGGRQRPTNLAAALEAVVGALFLDQGYAAARELVLRVMSSEMSAVDRGAAGKTPKAALQEAVQRDGSGPPIYRIVEVTGLDHDRQFTTEVTVAGSVMGSGTGARKSEAEQQAAARALEALDQTGQE